jgi:hypothetical protein
MHFIGDIFSVLAFSWFNAFALVVLAFFGGYIATWLFVWLWNAIKMK